MDESLENDEVMKIRESIIAKRRQEAEEKEAELQRQLASGQRPAQVPLNPEMQKKVDAFRAADLAADAIDEFGPRIEIARKVADQPLTPEQKLLADKKMAEIRKREEALKARFAEQDRKDDEESKQMLANIAAKKAQSELLERIRIKGIEKKAKEETKMTPEQLEKRRLMVEKLKQTKEEERQKELARQHAIQVAEFEQDIIRQDNDDSVKSLRNDSEFLKMKSEQLKKELSSKESSQRS